MLYNIVKIYYCSCQYVHLYYFMIENRGGSRNLRKGGGGAQHTVFFRTAASLETRASPKKADKRGV